MVDKIDKPDAPPPYAVTKATETKRDKPQEEKGQEDLPTFQRENPSLYREKFQMETVPLKTVRAPLEQIEKMLFRRATPRHGTPTAEANLIWKDGRTTEGVNFLLHSWQDFLKIKNLKVGAPIPKEFWSYQKPHLEITIRQAHSSGPWNLPEMGNRHEEKKVQAVAFGSQNQKLKRNIAIAALAVFVVSVILFLMRI